jgi:iron complex outermembrane receptor protein
VFEFRSDTSATADFDAFSPTVSIAFNPTENHILYASYSRGYRAGGLTPLSSDPSQPALYPFKPEFSNNIEIGIKNSFLDNKLLWNLAGFYTTIINAQVPTLVLPDAVTITKNTGRLNSRGVETEIMAMPFTGLRLSYSFGYTDARYKNLKIAVNGSEADLKGKQQLFTPEVTSMLAAQYEYKIKNSVSLLAGGEWYYIGTQYFDLANTIRQSGYSILNAKAGVRVKKISLVFWGRNLTDKHYISYAYDFGAVHLGNPLTYGVTASFKL